MSILDRFNPLKNFRRGFATNSSSSHSFVYLKEPAPNAHDDVIVEHEFQWNDFRLDTIKSKLFYVLSDRIGGSYWDSPSSDEVDEKYEELKDEFPELSYDDFLDAMSGMGVDHQSSGTIDADLARDPHVVVFGGNDNDGQSHERSVAIANGEVDWEMTNPEYDDDLPRDEFPFQRWDEVRVNGDGNIWTVPTDIRKNTDKVTVSRWIGEGASRSRDSKDALLTDLVLIKSNNRNY